MKKIEAVIKPFKLEQVKDSLAGVGIAGMTVIEVQGSRRPLAHAPLYQGRVESFDLLPKLKIELILPDDQLDRAVDAIIASARTGKTGDGKLFVTSVEDAFRIRTGEQGVAAV